MEIFIDNMLEHLFGSLSMQINIIAGAVFMVGGIILLGFSKKQSSKGKKAAGWICIGIGCLGVLSGIIQVMFR